MATVSSTKTYEAFTTPDGRWSYGYGQYNKPLSDLQGTPTIPTVLDYYYKKATGMSLSESATKISLPTYYIFAKPLKAFLSKKRIIEWYLDKRPRNSAFSVFSTAFDPTQSDLSRDKIIQALQAQTGAFTASTLATAAATAEATDFAQELTKGGTDPHEYSLFWPAMAALGGAYLLYRIVIRRY